MVPQSKFHSFSNLSTELRLKIWNHALDLQEPRVVEIRTIPHENCNSRYSPQLFCPRFSPKLHFLNVCQESRQIALGRATKENHLFLKTITFNPEVDTLYVSDEKDHWIYGPDGIITQLQKEWDLDRVQFLAADFQERLLKTHLALFPSLKRCVLVVRELKDGDWEHFRTAERKFRARRSRWAQGRYVLTPPQGEIETELSLAIYRGGRLTFVEEGL